MDTDAFRLGQEQAALRRVAAFAAEGSSLEQVFEAVTAEASTLLDGEPTVFMRHESGDGEAVVVAQTGDIVAVGDRFPIREDGGVATRIVRSHREERVDDLGGLPEGAPARSGPLRSMVGAPVTVYGEFWGWLGAGSRTGPMPAGSEDRLSMLAGIVAAAVVSLTAREGVRRLADEQAALLRVTALVARNAPSAEVFDAITEQHEDVLGGFPLAEDPDTLGVVAPVAARGQPRELVLGEVLEQEQLAQGRRRDARLPRGPFARRWADPSRLPSGNSGDRARRPEKDVGSALPVSRLETATMTRCPS